MKHVLVIEAKALISTGQYENRPYRITDTVEVETASTADGLSDVTRLIMEELKKTVDHFEGQTRLAKAAKAVAEVNGNAKTADEYDGEHPFKGVGREPGEDDEAPLKERPQAPEGQSDDGTTVVTIQYVNTARWNKEPYIDKSGKQFYVCKANTGERFSIYFHHAKLGYYPAQVGMTVRVRPQASNSDFHEVADPAKNGSG